MAMVDTLDRHFPLIRGTISISAALADSSALVSIVSTMRRTSVIIAFAYGVLFLKEKHWKAKLPCIVAILIGVFHISQP